MGWNTTQACSNITFLCVCVCLCHLCMCVPVCELMSTAHSGRSWDWAVTQWDRALDPVRKIRGAPVMIYNPSLHLSLPPVICHPTLQGQCPHLIRLLDRWGVCCHRYWFLNLDTFFHFPPPASNNLHQRGWQGEQTHQKMSVYVKTREQD